MTQVLPEWSNTHSNSRLWAFGSNGSGQLGIGHYDDVATPTEVIGSADGSTPGASELAAGGNHTVILFANSKIASTGENPDGRCPPSNKTSLSAPEYFKLAPDMSGADVPRHNIAATWSATFSQCWSGNVYASGTGMAGELGLGPSVSVCHRPKIIEELGLAVHGMAASMAHAVAVMSNGEVMGWGKGRKGQIGMPSETVWTPRRIKEVSFAAAGAVCGKDFTCVYGPPSTGEILILGMHDNDRFGIHRDMPATIAGYKQVAASWGSIYVLFHDGKLLSWGRNDHGQLPPKTIPLLKAIAAGSEHCLGLTQEGRVLVWGWGEHGNCGSPVDERGDVAGRVNEIALAESATAIFAGCATSFIAT